MVVEEDVRLVQPPAADNGNHSAAVVYLTVEHFETLANPVNCDVVTVGPKEGSGRPQFVSGAWGVEGLRLR